MTVGSQSGVPRVAAVVGVYVAVGVAWIVGSAALADYVAQVTVLSRAMVEVAKGVGFVAVTGAALALSMGRWARRLRDSEARIRLQATALSAAANAVMITDRDGVIEWVNHAFTTISGYPPQAAVGSTPRLLKSGLQDQAFYEDLWDTVTAGKAWRGRTVNRHADGHLYTVNQTVTPVVDAHGTVGHFVAVQEDITAQVEADRKLGASRRRLQALFDHALDAILLADDDGRYVDANPAAEALTGYTRDELLGMGPADLAAPDREADDVAAQFDRFLIDGTQAGTFTLRREDGQIVDTEYRAVSDIQPGVHLSILRDVTARNDMVRELARREAQFRQLAENATDIVAQVRFDPEAGMHIDYVNRAAADILGYPLARFYDEPDLLFDLLERGSSQLDDVLAQVATGVTHPTGSATVQVRRADGNRVWLEINASLADASTAPPTVQIVARDVTARHQTLQALEQALDDQQRAGEQLRDLNRTKDTFLQSVSHELRTPLTAILGFSQLLADPDHPIPDEHIQGFHERILTNARRQARVLDDLLDVDRFTRGDIQPNRSPTDLAALVQRMVDTMDLADHPVSLDLAPVTMDVDVDWVERIIANLLRNITRHTPPDTRTQISMRPTSDGAKITVDDDGPGIPEPDRQRLLEPFEQGAASANAAQPGTGMGLALVNAFAELHGGDVHITDSPTGGTRVTVALTRPRGTMRSTDDTPALMTGAAGPASF